MSLNVTLSFIDGASILKHFETLKRMLAIGSLLRVVRVGINVLLMYSAFIYLLAYFEVEKSQIIMSLRR